MNTLTSLIPSPRASSKGVLLCLLAALSASAQVAITKLPTLGGSSVQATGFNGSGQIAGFSQTAGNAAQHAFLFSGGQMYDLGTLGGGFSLARGINAAGQVIGEAFTTNNAHYHAFLFDGGVMTDLGTLGGSDSTVSAINDAGQVAGDADLPRDAGASAFLYRGGPLLNLGAVGGGYSSAVALNNLGQVAGNLYFADGSCHAFLFDGALLQDLGALGGSYSAASAINDAGQVVGEFETDSRDTHAFLFSNGTLSDLGTLGGTYSTAYAINQSGQVIGDSTTLDDLEYHAFLSQNGLRVDLGALAGGFSSASAINNLGQVVGYSENSTFGDSAFLWQDGAMTDLNSFLPADSGWNLTYAGFINDAGQVVGYGTYLGKFAWYLLGTKAANRPPVAVAVAPPTVECPNPVSLDGSRSSDPDQDPLTFEWREGTTLLGSDPTLSVNLPVGSHLITLTVTDAAAASSQAAVSVTVVDSTAPFIQSAVVNPTTLGQPNRQMVPVEVEVVASDSCDPAPSCRLLSITSSDPITGSGDNTSPDWLITGPLTAQLRAERSPHGGDRVYTLTIQCADAAGNTSMRDVTVVVPKSGKH